MTERGEKLAVKRKSAAIDETDFNQAVICHITNLIHNHSFLVAGFYNASLKLCKKKISATKGSRRKPGSCRCKTWKWLHFRNIKIDQVELSFYFSSLNVVDTTASPPAPFCMKHEITRLPLHPHPSNLLFSSAFWIYSRKYVYFRKRRGQGATKPATCLVEESQVLIL